MTKDTSIVRVEDYYNENDTYVRSNFMISSKYKSTLFANRLMAISLSRIGTAKESEEGYLTVKVKGKDIQSLCKAKGNAFFTQLSNTAQGMTGQSIGWSNPETQEFEYISVVTSATYQNGEFTIEFHKKIKDYLIGLKRSFTSFNLPIMLSFKSTYSFRLFELIKSKSYYKKGEERDDNLFRIEFDINELRLDLGVVNAEIDSVRRVLNKKKGKPDYAKAVEASPEKQFTSWGDFRRYVIDTAVNEINEKPETGIRINRYEPKKAGRGGKVYAVEFFVEKISDKKKKDISPLKEYDELEFLDEIRDIIGNIKNREARSIGEAAGWNIEKIKRNYEYSLTRDVDDIVAFMIKAVKEDWALCEKKPRKKTAVSEGANSFNNFTARDYDYDEMLAAAVK